MNEELRIKITAKKRDLQSLRSSRQKEIANISGNADKELSKRSGLDINFKTDIIHCVLDDLTSVADQTEDDDELSETATSNTNA